jgi:hypothetical protein
MMRLFRAYTLESIVASRTGAEPARYAGIIHWDWVRVGREKPAAPYSWLIKRYERLPEQPERRIITLPDGTKRRVVCGGRAWAEQAVDECFTEAEIKLLTCYLLQHHRLEVVTMQVELPINGMLYSTGVRTPRVAGVGDRAELDRLSKGLGYDLPFAAWKLYRMAHWRDASKDTVTFYM